MKKYLEQVKRRVDDLQNKIVQIVLNKVLSFIQYSLLIDPIDVQEIGSKSNWTTPLISYLKNGALLDRRGVARKLKVQAARFILIEDDLSKRGFSRLYLRCLSPEKADCVMREIHEGIYGNHLGSRSLVHKLIKVGYYWPTMQKDAQTYVKAYEKCRRFSNVIRQPMEELTPMTALWPFTQ